MCETNPTLPFYGTEPPWRDTFSWGTFALVVDRVLRAHDRNRRLGLPSNGRAAVPGFCVSSVLPTTQYAFPRCVGPEKHTDHAPQSCRVGESGEQENRAAQRLRVGLP